MIARANVSVFWSLRGGTTKQSPLQILRWKLLQQMKNLLRKDGFFDGVYSQYQQRFSALSYSEGKTMLIHLAMATQLSGLGNDGRRKRLKLPSQSFNPPQT